MKKKLVLLQKFSGQRGGKKALPKDKRRDAGVVERGGLENR